MYFHCTHNGIYVFGCRDECPVVERMYLCMSCIHPSSKSDSRKVDWILCCCSIAFFSSSHYFIGVFGLSRSPSPCVLYCFPSYIKFQMLSFAVSVVRIFCRNVHAHSFKYHVRNAHGLMVLQLLSERQTHIFDARNWASKRKSYFEMERKRNKKFRESQIRTYEHSISCRQDK